MNRARIAVLLLLGCSPRPDAEHASRAVAPRDAAPASTPAASMRPTETPAASAAPVAPLRLTPRPVATTSGARPLPPESRKPPGSGWWCFDERETDRDPTRATCFRASGECGRARSQAKAKGACAPENRAACAATLNSSELRCFDELPRCEAYVASRPREMPLSACVLWD